MKTDARVIFGLLLGAVVLAVGFQNCAPGFQAPLGVTGGIGPDFAVVPTPTPYPNTFKITTTDSISATVSSMQVDPRDSMRIYALDSSTQSISRSVNAGVTWTRLCGLPVSVGTVLHFAGGTSPQLFATYYRSVYKVMDAGGAGCPVVRTSTTDMWFAVTGNGRLYFAQKGLPLSTSVNGGRNWTYLTNAISSASNVSLNPSAFLFAPQYVSTDTVYAGVTTTAEKALYQISPGGAVRLGAYTYSPVKIFADPVSSTTFYITVSLMTYVTTDNGATWATTDTFAEMHADGSVTKTAVSGANALFYRKLNPSAVTWATVGTFVAANPPICSLNNTTIACAVANAAQISVDLGATYAKRSPALSPGEIKFSSIVGVGDRMYAANRDVVFKSNDAGDTWSLMQDISSWELSSAEPRITIAPNAPQTAFIRPDYYFGSVYSTPFGMTTDGFTGVTRVDLLPGLSQMHYSWQTAFAPNADGTSGQMMAWQKSTHLDAGSWTSKIASGTPSWFVWYPWPAAFVNSSDNDKTLYGAGTVLYEYSFASNTSSVVTTRLPFTDPAGLDVRFTSGGVKKIFVISSTGRIAESSDGITFTLKSSGAVTTSLARAVFVAADATGVQFAAGSIGGGALSTSSNSGATWVSQTLPGCVIRDIAAARSRWLIACEGTSSREIAR